MSLSKDAGIPAYRGDLPRAERIGRLLIKTTRSGNIKIAIDRDVLTIGRSATNDICIRSRFISRFHARIFMTPAGPVIEDLDSRNGTSVNWARVRHQRLRSGDVIHIGRDQLRYIDLGDESPGDGNA
jgi:pSer/pThr/pTyr-binding forkhead associated (FHA) protein